MVNTERVTTKSKLKFIKTLCPAEWCMEYVDTSHFRLLNWGGAAGGQRAKITLKQKPGGPSIWHTTPATQKHNTPSAANLTS